MGLILLIILILFLVGGLAPWGPYSGPYHGYGYGNGGIGLGGILLIILVVMLLTGRI
jgi:hypothetical protein